MLPLLFVQFQCSKETHELPNYESHQGLYISWTDGSDSYHYQIGINALNSRSFVINPTHDGGVRQFVFQYMINQNKQIDIIIGSAPALLSTDFIDRDLRATLLPVNSFKFNFGDTLEHFGVKIVYHDKKDSYFSTSLIEQDQQNHHFKITNTKLTDLSDGTQYLEVDYEFDCLMHHNTQNVVINGTNGKGKMAFRLLQ